MNDHPLPQTPARDKHKDTPPQKSPGAGSFVKEIIQLALLSLIVVVPIRMYVASPFLVHGASMAPTFATGDYLIIDQMTYNFEKPERGDVIVFRYPKNPSTFFIKRIIGLPGETIRMENGTVFIVQDGGPGERKLAEPYIKKRGRATMQETLEDGEYFVLGDNRPSSADSRVWGPLEEGLITGKAFVRLFPFTEIDMRPGKHTF